MRYLVIILLLPQLLFAAQKAIQPERQKEPVVIRTDNLEEFDLSDHCTILEETDKSFSSEDIVQGKCDLLFSNGYITQVKDDRRSLWVRIALRSEMDKKASWILKTDKLFSRVTTYFVYPGEKVSVQKSGWSISYTERTIVDPDVIFNLITGPHQDVVVYMHIQTNLNRSSLKKIQAVLIPETQWNKVKLRNYNFLSVYAGICLLAIFYWLVTYFYSKRANYLFLILATSSSLMLCLDIYGITSFIFPDKWLWLIQYGEQTIWLPLVVLSYFVISDKANPFKDHFPNFIMIWYWFTCIATIVALIGLPFILQWKEARLISLSMIMFSMLQGLILINILLIKKGYKSSAYAFVAVLPMFIGMGAYIFYAFGILPERYKVITPIGALSTVIVFFYGMVNYVRVLRAKRRKESEENERFIREQNIILERKVEERTDQLQIANTELSSALHHIRETQDQLVAAEKLKENDIIRSRISQDIHDDVSAELTRISWISELAKANITKGDTRDMPSLLDKVTISSRESISKLGEIIWAINPKSDNLDSLLAYMRNYVSKYLEVTPFKYNIDFPENVGIAIGPELKRNLFLILKEALHNAVKYSEASMIHVVFEYNDGAYVLSVVDDGKGIDDSVVQGGGNGMQNMRHRINQLNGSMHIETSEGKGTRIVFSGSI